MRPHPSTPTSVTTYQFIQYQWVLDRLVPMISVVMSNPSSCGYQRALSDLSLLPCVAVCTNCEHLPTWLSVGLQRCAPHNCICQNGLSVPKLLRKTVWYFPCMQLVHVLHYSCTVRACCSTCWPTNHLHRRDGMCVLYNNTCVCMHVTLLSIHAVVLLTLPLDCHFSNTHEFHCVGSCLHLPLCRSCMSGELKEVGHMASWQEGGVGQVGHSHY